MCVWVWVGVCVCVCVGGWVGVCGWVSVGVGGWVCVGVSEEVGHAHVSAYICIENITKLPAKFKQVLFESVLRVCLIRPINPIQPCYSRNVNRS